MAGVQDDLILLRGQTNSADAKPDHEEDALSKPSSVDDLELPIDALEDQEEPTLPPYHAASDQDGAPFLTFNKRKRSTVSQLMSDSSEMPIFSSDDDPAAENYRDGHGRQKRQYTGSWDCQQPIKPSGLRAESRMRRKLERQVDSGIFMGSDASIDSSLDGLPIQPPAPAWKLLGPQFTQVPRSARQLEVSAAEVEARRRIQHCLDADNETVDLSNMNLDTLSNTTVAKLTAISPAPFVRRGVPFTNRDPQLKLFLFQNKLTRLPKELFQLDHLTVLSLRANRLTEISPVILRMKNLKELNLSQNLLTRLPMELLELVYSPDCRLETLHLFPNPFYRPQALEPGADDDEISQDPSSLFDKPEVFGNRWLGDSRDVCFRAKRWARTPVEFSTTRGDVCSTFRLGEGMYLETEDLCSEPAVPNSSGVRQVEARPTKVPSLTELMLQSCLRSTEITPDYWRNSYMCDPSSAQDYSHIIESLEEVQRQREQGSLRCTVCQRDVVRPTARWVEWWELLRTEVSHFDSVGLDLRTGRPSDGRTIKRRDVPLTLVPEERLVPFLRQACSWGCVKDTVRGLGVPEPVQ